jgi:hypothetical protein
MGGSFESAQRSAYLALRKKGWVVTPSTIARGYFQAVKPEREDVVSAKDFLTLHGLAQAKDEAWVAKQRAKAAS